MRYQLQNDQGEKISNHRDYPAALSAAQKLAGWDGVIGHAGDLDTGGDKTLIWASLEASIDDCGANAIGVIIENEFLGWSDGKENEGYHVDHFFNVDGYYLGADDDGIYPIFEN
jgi:hypothetical protein